MFLALASLAFGQTTDFRPIPDLVPPPEPIEVEGPAPQAPLPELVTFDDGSTVTTKTEDAATFEWVEPRGPLRRLLRGAEGAVANEALTLTLHPRRLRRRRLQTWTDETLRPWLAERAVSDGRSAK